MAHNGWKLSSLYSILVIIIHSTNAALYKWQQPATAIDGRLYVPQTNMTDASKTCMMKIQCGSSGLTFGLWIKPSAIPRDQVKYWFSNGGDSPYSPGIFMLQEGGTPAKFVIGVTSIDSTEPEKKLAWIQDPFYLMLDKWINIAIVWDKRMGLYVYVDGKVFKNSITTAKKVLYVDYLKTHNSPYYRQLYVDLPYQGEAGTTEPRVRDIIFRSETTSQADIHKVVGYQPTTFGCLLSAVKTASIFEPSTRSADDPLSCWKFCVSNDAFALTPSRSCRCIASLAAVTSSLYQPCPEKIGSETWQLFRVTHRILDESNEMVVRVSTTSIDGKPKDTFYTGDPVVFDVTVLYGRIGGKKQPVTKPLYVVVDLIGPLGATQLYFNSLQFNATWQASGKHQARVTVVTEMGRASATANVTMKDSSDSPVLLANTTLISWLNRSTPGAVNLLGFAVAKGAKRCKLQNASGDVLKEVSGDNYIVELHHVATVNYNGIHRFFLHCSNRYDSSTDNSTVLVPRWKEQTLLASINETVMVPLPHASTYAGRLSAMTTSGLALPIRRLTADAVEVDPTGLQQDTLLLRLLLDHRFLSQDVVNRYQWPRVGVTSDRLTGLPNDTYNVAYHLNASGVYDVDIHDNFAGNHMYYRTAYLPSSGVSIPQEYSFNKTGVFTLTFRACNRLHCAKSKFMVGAEIPVLKAHLLPLTVMSVRRSARLRLFINDGTQLPVVRANYEVSIPGQTVTVGRIINTEHKFGPFLIPVQFTNYGKQRVSIRLFNKISETSTSSVVQVGTPLKDLRIVSMKTHTLVGNDVQFGLHLADGAPIQLSVSFQDSFTLLLPTVNRQDHAVGSNLTLYATPETNTGTGKHQVRLVESAQFSQRVGVLQMNGIDRPMKLSIRMSKQGHFRVTVEARNPFNSLKVKLCTSVFAENPPAHFCNFKISLSAGGKLMDEQEVKNEKSKALILRPTISSTCLKLQELTFDWEVYRLQDNSSVIKPGSTPLICSGLQNPGLTQITIPDFALDYGRYAVVVRATQSKSLVNFATRTVFVKSIRSHLVANLTREPSSDDVDMYSNIIFDFSRSGDPDDRGNSGDSGLSFEFFCFVKDSYKGDAIEKGNLTDFVLKTNATGDNSEDPLVSVYDYKGECFIPKSVINILNLPSNRSINFQASNMVADTLVTFRLVVSDALGRQVSADVDLKVKSATNMRDMMSRLDELLNTKDKTALLKFVNSASSRLNETGNATEATAAVGKMLNALDRVSGNLSDYSQVSMCTKALESLTENPERVTEESKTKAANSMKNTAAGVAKFSNQPLSAINNTAGTLVKGMSNVVPQKSFAEQEAEKAAKLAIQMEELKKQEEEAMNKTAAENGEEPVNDDPGSFTTKDIPDGMYDCFSIEEITKRMRYEHPDEIKTEIDACIDKKKKAMEEKNKNDKSVSDSVMGAGSITGDVLLKKTDKIKINSPKLDMQVDKSKSKNGTKEMKSAFGGIAVPDGAIPGGDGAGAQLMATPESPFTWAKGKISSPVIALTYSDSGGKPIVVKNTPKPINIMIPRKQAPKQVRYYIVTALGKGGHKKRKMNHHSVTVDQNSSSISLYLRPENPDDTYIVYFKHGGFPNATYYDYKEIIPRPNATKESNDTEEVQELMYTVTPPAYVTEACGKYTVGVALWGSRFTDTVTERNFTYNMASYVSMCRYYNTTSNEWDNAGVKVGPRTTMKQTQCVANHLTSFGGDFYVPPNTIDFGSVFAKFKDLHENAAVFATVISIVILYFIVIIWARWADRKDVLKWGATHLEDNLPSDSYNYELTVMTGLRGGAGTSSKISFIISGDDGDTGVRHLYDGKRKHFGRGSVLNFIMSVESNLGQLTFLRVWHDNTGKGKDKSWYLDQIIVTDLQTGDKYFFLNNRWLAVEEDDGMVERIVPVAGYSDLVTFKHLFATSFTSKMRNDHLWLSVFSRPTRSSFTRVQRVSCCVALLFLTMISNAMFFKSEERVKPAGITIGRITITTTTIYVSIMSTLIVFPPSLIIVTFFRKCKAKGNQITQENQEMSKASQKYKWRALDPNSELFQNAQASGGDKTKSHTKLWDSLRNILAFHQKQTDEDSMEMGDGVRPKKKKPFLFPHWCIYIAWLFVFLSIFASAFFVILYSMQWGKEKAEEWLVAFVLSFFQSVVVVQPVKVLLFVAFISLVLKKPELDEEEEMLDDKLLRPDEELLGKDPVDIQQIQLQRRMASAVAAPPDNKSLLAMREQRLKEIAMEAIIKEMATYFIFVMIVFFLSYQTRSTQSFYLHNTISSNFFSKLSNIHTYSDFYDYVNETLMPGLYAEDWYNGKKLTWREALCINDGNYQTIRVGVPRFRQFRIKSNSCSIQKELKDVIHHCRDAYNWLDDDTKPYYPGWVKTKTKEEMKKLKKEKSPFVYRNSFDLKGIPYIAKIHMYKGGGYVMNFARTRKKSQELVNEIYESNWLDTRTRAVFIEFAVYNVASNLFGAVTMTVEFLSSGGAITRGEAKIFRLFSYVGGFGVIVITTEVIFGIFVLVYLVKEIKAWRRDKKKYFKQFWNILEFSTLVASIAAVVMYVFKKILTTLAMRALHTGGGEDSDIIETPKPVALVPKVPCPALIPPKKTEVISDEDKVGVVSGKFVNFGSLATYDEFFTFMVGFVVFIATIKFIKILKFNRRMGMLGSTIQMATKDLKSFSVMFVIYFMAFCQAAYLLFGRNLANYSTFISTLEALLSMALGSFNFHDLISVQPILGPIFFYLFMSLVSIGLLGMFLTIINDSFAVVKSNAELQSNDYELVDFMWKRFKNLFGLASMHDTSPLQKKEEEDEGLPPLTNQEKELILS